MNLSIIIPTLNEAENIEKLIKRLQNCDCSKTHEIIVVDAGSNDNTQELAKKTGATVLPSPKKGRAPQMNFGVKNANGNVYYFVHADSLPPSDYCLSISKSIQQGAEIGGFRFKFDSDKKLLAFNNWTTQFNKIFVRGGDQTIFISKGLFDELNGFDESFRIMEEYDFIERAQKKTSYKVIQKDVLVSARKYDTNSWLRVQFANFVVFSMYRFGCSQDMLVNTYKRLLNYR